MTGKVLVVDDEKGIRLTFESFLSDEGCEVWAASGYDEAVALLTERDYDLVFADIILGAKSGIDVLREVRLRNPTCPVIMITGAPDIKTASEAVRLGAFDYIPKPVVQQTLLKAALKALEHKRLLDEKERYRSNLDAIFRTVREGIISVDRDMAIREMNEAVSRICGFGRGVIGEDFRSLMNKCEGKCLHALTEMMKTRKPIELHRFQCVHKDRQPLVVAVTAYPLVDDGDRVSGGVLVVRDETRIDTLERNLACRELYHHIIGRSDKMQRVYSLIEALADSPSIVLITGESGTGKELVAEALHAKGPRSQKPLVKVNCSALSENLLESELFGHVKGAFTGAVRDKVGRFEKARGGTIFLDEIGDLSPRIQLKLLRVLQNMEFERVGDSTPIRVDVRVIAATNRDLRSRIRAGDFRADLYYRLKVVEVHLPPLRERPEDIPLLIDHFIKTFNERLKRNILGVSPDVLEIFGNYPWPGNVRELEHVIEHAVLLGSQRLITRDDLPAEIMEQGPTSHRIQAAGGGTRESFIEALDKAGWNKARAAHLLGISRATLYRKLQELDISDENPFKR